MKLFKIKNWQLEVEPEVWGYLPFKALLDRDKTKEKEVAMKEMLFVYSFADVKSDYMQITDEDKRTQEIKADIGLAKSWKYDAKVQAAVDFYTNRSLTVSENLYQAAVESANAIAKYLKGTNQLLKERDDKGKPVFTISTITSALKAVPTIMSDLKSSYKELIKEKEDMEGKKKGKREFGLFEDGV